MNILPENYIEKLAKGYKLEDSYNCVTSNKRQIYFTYTINFNFLFYMQILLHLNSLFIQPQKY